MNKIGLKERFINVIVAPDRYYAVNHIPSVIDDYTLVRASDDIVLSIGKKPPAQAIIFSEGMALCAAFEGGHAEKIFTVFNRKPSEHSTLGCAKSVTPTENLYWQHLGTAACIEFIKHPENLLHYLCFLSNNRNSDGIRPTGMFRTYKDCDLAQSVDVPGGSYQYWDILIKQRSPKTEATETSDSDFLLVKSPVLNLVMTLKGSAQEHFKGLLRERVDDLAQCYEQIVLAILGGACAVFKRQPGMFRDYVSEHGRFIPSNIRKFEGFFEPEFAEFWRQQMTTKNRRG